MPEKEHVEAFRYDIPSGAITETSRRDISDRRAGWHAERRAFSFLQRKSGRDCLGIHAESGGCDRGHSLLPGDFGNPDPDLKLPPGYAWVIDRTHQSRNGGGISRTYMT